MKRLIPIFIISFILQFPATSQHISSNIKGQTIVINGPTLPAVNVELSGDYIGKMNLLTSKKGKFKFIGLPPGNYKLKFEHEGFNTIIRQNIQLPQGKNLKLYVPMEPSYIKEEIIINGITEDIAFPFSVFYPF